MNLAGAGTQTAGLAFGGETNGGNPSAATEAYNGTSWTIDTSMSTARRFLGGTGTQPAGLAFGGLTTTQVASTEEFTGTALGTKKITTS
jgi:hypothetical protein